MIGIKEIGIHIPIDSINNLDRLEKFETNEVFINNKIGFKSLSQKPKELKSSDLCVLAFEDLLKKIEINKDEIEFICVCTQNPDYTLPHTSALVHDKLGLSNDCAAFDISLGCSGWVYGIHNAKAFMEQNGYKKGLFFTSDPYSDIIDPDDKSTTLLFGDAATVTLLTDEPVLTIEKGVFQSAGSKYNTLIKEENKSLFMNGREIFNFVIKHAPKMVDKCLEKNSVDKDSVDIFLFHQASKYILDNLTRKIKVEADKVPFTAGELGNTVSSTIPILLQPILHDDKMNTIFTSGFGVGLSMAATVLKRH